MTLDPRLHTYVYTNNALLAKIRCPLKCAVVGKLGNIILKQLFRMAPYV